MIAKFVRSWYKNKDELEKYIRYHSQDNYDSYDKLVRLVTIYIINKADDGFYDENNIHEIDDGDYQGTLIYIIPRKTYQPDEDDYIYTSVGYGSCSGCDTLLSINGYSTERLPDDEQVKDYMTLCLHIVQSFKKLESDDYKWHNHLDILKFINSFTEKHKEPIEYVFTQGHCYWFAVILKERFNGDIYYDYTDNHFVVKIGNHYYDIKGEVTNPETLAKLKLWYEYQAIEPAESERIIKNCINIVN